MIAFAAIIFASCNSSVTPDALYGKWKYVKIEHPNADPTDSVRSADLAAKSPSIEFFKDNTYVIHWENRVLSHGKFAVDKRNILITEILPDGTTRQFPFYVSDFSSTRIVFDTKGEDASVVTAIKQ